MAVMPRDDGDAAEIYIYEHLSKWLDTFVYIIFMY